VECSCVSEDGTTLKSANEFGCANAKINLDAGKYKIEIVECCHEWIRDGKSAGWTGKIVGLHSINPNLLSAGTDFRKMPNMDPNNPQFDTIFDNSFWLARGTSPAFFNDLFRTNNDARMHYLRMDRLHVVSNGAFAVKQDEEIKVPLETTKMVVAASSFNHTGGQVWLSCASPFTGTLTVRITPSDCFEDSEITQEGVQFDSDGNPIYTGPTKGDIVEVETPECEVPIAILMAGVVQDSEGHRKVSLQGVQNGLLQQPGVILPEGRYILEITEC
ncbi:unnamed protein product, partial [marine sediment metagenome]